MKVLSARHIPSGEMRLTGAVCACVCTWTLFFIVVLFEPSLVLTVRRITQLFTRPARVHPFSLAWYTRVCRLVCFPPLLTCAGVHHTHECAFVYGQLALVCSGGLGSARGLSAAQRGDLRNQPCSTFCPGPLPSRTQPEGGQCQTDQQPTHPQSLQSLQSRSLHQPLAQHSLDRKELTLAFKQGHAKSSCQSQKPDSPRLEGFGFMVETEQE